MKREALVTTMQPVLKSKDLMEKFHISRGSALKLMQHESLHAYYIGKTLVVEQQYFDTFLDTMLDCGGTVSMSMITELSPKFITNKSNIKDAFDYVMEILNDDEMEGFCNAVFNNEN